MLVDNFKILYKILERHIEKLSEIFQSWNEQKEFCVK